MRGSAAASGSGRLRQCQQPEFTDQGVPKELQIFWRHLFERQPPATTPANGAAPRLEEALAGGKRHVQDDVIGEGRATGGRQHGAANRQLETAAHGGAAVGLDEPIEVEKEPGPATSPTAIELRRGRAHAARL